MARRRATTPGEIIGVSILIAALAMGVTVWQGVDLGRLSGYTERIEASIGHARDDEAEGRRRGRTFSYSVCNYFAYYRVSGEDMTVFGSVPGDCKTLGIEAGPGIVLVDPSPDPAMLASAVLVEEADGSSTRIEPPDAALEQHVRTKQHQTTLILIVGATALADAAVFLVIGVLRRRREDAYGSSVSAHGPPWVPGGPAMLLILGSSLLASGVLLFLAVDTGGLAVVAPVAALLFGLGASALGVRRWVRRYAARRAEVADSEAERAPQPDARGNPGGVPNRSPQIERSVMAQPVTRADILGKQFTKTKWREGYDPDEVDDFLDRLSLELEAKATRIAELEARIAGLTGA